MAAPPSVTISDLSGRWLMNTTLSDDVAPSLALQGIGWMTRKMISLASVSLAVRQYQDAPLPTHAADAAPPETETCARIDIVQSASGLTSTTERRCVDGRWRPHEDWLFGKVRGRTFWVDTGSSPENLGAALGADPTLGDAQTLAYLSEGWEAGSDRFVVSYVENLDAAGGWTALQVWGFQEVHGERRHVRKLCVRKGDDRVLFRLVYDYEGPDVEDADLVA